MASDPLTVPEPDLSIEGAILRPWHRDDAARLAQAWRDPAIAEFNPTPEHPTLVLAQRWIEREPERRKQGRALDLVIDTGSVVGEVGLSGFHSESQGALIGYWLLPEARGQGRATAALQAVVSWAGPALGLNLVVARCHESNAPSQRVAERCGFVHEANDDTRHQLWRYHY